LRSVGIFLSQYAFFARLAHAAFARALADKANFRIGSKYLLGLLAAALLGCNSISSQSVKTPEQSQPIAPAQGPGLEARLNGRYVERLQIHKGDEAVTGPQQPLSLEFKASGMKGVKQFEMVVAPEPAEAFDLKSSTFEPETPFITVGSGVQFLPENHLRIAGLSLGMDRDGEAGLGTLNLQTSSAFSATTQARIRVVSFSIGPSSRERDTYSEQELNLGVSVGP